MKLGYLAFALFAALSLGSAAQAQTRGVTANAVKIGTVTDLSGALASWGVSATNGVRMRFDEANAAGGVNGRRIDFVASPPAEPFVESVETGPDEREIIRFSAPVTFLEASALAAGPWTLSQDGKTIHAEKGSRLKHRLSTGQKVLLPRSAGRPEKKQEMEQK